MKTSGRRETEKDGTGERKYEDEESERWNGTRRRSRVIKRRTCGGRRRRAWPWPSAAARSWGGSDTSRRCTGYRCTCSAAGRGWGDIQYNTEETITITITRAKFPLEREKTRGRNDREEWRDATTVEGRRSLDRHRFSDGSTLLWYCDVLRNIIMTAAIIKITTIMI